MSQNREDETQNFSSNDESSDSSLSSIDDFDITEIGTLPNPSEYDAAQGSTRNVIDKYCSQSNPAEEDKRTKLLIPFSNEDSKRNPDFKKYIPKTEIPKTEEDRRKTFQLNLPSTSTAITEEKFKKEFARTTGEENREKWRHIPQIFPPYFVPPNSPEQREASKNVDIHQKTKIQSLPPKLRYRFSGEYSESKPDNKIPTTSVKSDEKSKADKTSTNTDAKPPSTNTIFSSGKFPEELGRAPVEYRQSAPRPSPQFGFRDPLNPQRQMGSSRQENLVPDLNLRFPPAISPRIPERLTQGPTEENKEKPLPESELTHSKFSTHGVIKGIGSFRRQKSATDSNTIFPPGKSDESTGTSTENKEKLQQLFRQPEPSSSRFTNTENLRDLPSPQKQTDRPGRVQEASKHGDIHEEVSILESPTKQHCAPSGQKSQPSLSQSELSPKFKKLRELLSSKAKPLRRPSDQKSQQPPPSPNYETLRKLLSPDYQRDHSGRVPHGEISIFGTPTKPYSRPLNKSSECKSDPGYSTKVEENPKRVRRVTLSDLNLPDARVIFSPERFEKELTKTPNERNSQQLSQGLESFSPNFMPQCPQKRIDNSNKQVSTSQDANISGTTKKRRSCFFSDDTYRQPDAKKQLTFPELDVKAKNNERTISTRSSLPPRRVIFFPEILEKDKISEDNKQNLQQQQQPVDLSSQSSKKQMTDPRGKTDLQKKVDTHQEMTSKTQRKRRYFSNEDNSVPQPVCKKHTASTEKDEKSESSRKMMTMGSNQPPTRLMFPPERFAKEFYTTKSNKGKSQHSTQQTKFYSQKQMDNSRCTVGSDKQVDHHQKASSSSTKKPLKEKQDFETRRYSRNYDSTKQSKLSQKQIDNSRCTVGSDKQVGHQKDSFSSTSKTLKEKPDFKPRTYSRTYDSTQQSELSSQKQVDNSRCTVGSDKQVDNQKCSLSSTPTSRRLKGKLDFEPNTYYKTPDYVRQFEFYSQKQKDNSRCTVSSDKQIDHQNKQIDHQNKKIDHQNKQIDHQKGSFRNAPIMEEKRVCEPRRFDLGSISSNAKLPHPQEMFSSERFVRELSRHPGESHGQATQQSSEGFFSQKTDQGSDSENWIDDPIAQDVIWDSIRPNEARPSCSHHRPGEVSTGWVPIEENDSEYSTSPGELSLEDQALDEDIFQLPMDIHAKSSKISAALPFAHVPSYLIYRDRLNLRTRAFIIASRLSQLENYVRIGRNRLNSTTLPLPVDRTNSDNPEERRLYQGTTLAERRASARMRNRDLCREHNRINSRERLLITFRWLLYGMAEIITDIRYHLSIGTLPPFLIENITSYLNKIRRMFNRFSHKFPVKMKKTCEKTQKEIFKYPRAKLNSHYYPFVIIFVNFLQDIDDLFNGL